MVQFIPTEYLWAAFVVGLLLLIKGADVFVEGASTLARRFGLSKTVVGLTVVAIGTSAPEFAVSGYAALQGAGELAVANVVGSNIFNIGFILALCAMASPILIDKPTLFRDCFFLLLGSILLSVFALSDGLISRLDGFILCSLLIGYLTFLITKSPTEAKEKSIPSETVAKYGHLKEIGLTILGLSGLLLGCNLVVDSAKIFATELGISEWLIGITVIAIGTSLPELVTAVVSIVKQQTELGVSGLIGSDIFNIFGVIGSTALLAPMAVSPESRIPFAFLILTIVLTAAFMRTHWRLSRAEGLVMIAVATFRFSYEIFS